MVDIVRIFKSQHQHLSFALYSLRPFQSWNWRSTEKVTEEQLVSPKAHLSYCSVSSPAKCPMPQYLHMNQPCQHRQNSTHGNTSTQYQIHHTHNCTSTTKSCFALTSSDAYTMQWNDWDLWNAKQTGRGRPAFSTQACIPFPCNWLHNISVQNIVL